MRVKEFVDSNDHFLAEVEEIKEEKGSEKETSALCLSLKNVFEQYAKLNKKIPPENLMRVSAAEDPKEVADIVVAQLNLKLEEKQRILEINNAQQRLEELLNLMTGEIEILEVEKKIRTRVKKQMERSQKEYYLNEQMQAIQKELGDKDDYQAEIEELKTRLKKKKLSAEAQEKVEKELRKLSMMSPMSAESAVVRNYVDWVLDLPWEDYAKTDHDLDKAQTVLDEDHWGLEKVKERVLEHLSVQALTKSQKSPILCLVGPPGVGKTSLASSVARALARPFVRLSLGGVRDEADIRGHRRTYVGAMPGKVIQGLKKSEFSNPVMLLDEIDKMSSDFRGDPSSALLEVLDPEQNKTFSDHYLEVDYDLSHVLFFATANSLHKMPRPLLDRMEIIYLEGYIDKEKLHIAKRYLIPKQLKKHGLKIKEVDMPDAVVRDVIQHYNKRSWSAGT